MTADFLYAFHAFVQRIEHDFNIRTVTLIPLITLITQIMYVDTMLNILVLPIFCYYVKFDCKTSFSKIKKIEQKVHRKITFGKKYTPATLCRRLFGF